jgi:streptomycin 6-kinase
MLMERLGPALSTEGHSIDEQMARICATLKRAWRPLPEPMGFATGVEKANWHLDFVQANWDALGRPCPEPLAARALALCEARCAAFAPEAAMLLHGDPHEENTLADPAAPGAYRLVDPDGLFAEPAYDLSVMMRGWTEELLAGDPLALGRARCHRLAALSGAPAQAIWEWGIIERVSTGLLLLKLGDPARARDTLTVAEAWAYASA